MRITVTLDEDVAKFLRNEMRVRKISLKAAINHFLRIALKVAGEGARRPFVVHPLPMGLPLDSGHECVEELIEHIEGSKHR
jgi:hypothetical protein